ncbi:MAG: hypothetical protein ACYCSO_01355 [Cuniculiplasma sp.]
MDTKGLLNKYLGDLRNIGTRIYTATSTYYHANNSGRDAEYKFTPFDLDQIKLNIPLDIHEELQTLITDMGYSLLKSDSIEFIKISDEELENLKVDDSDIPEIQIDSLGTIESIDLCYNFKLKQKVTDSPIDVIEISYEIKNALRFPDEFFNAFPSKSLESPHLNSSKNCTKYGFVQGNRVYYNFYQILPDSIIPVSSYPAKINLSQNITTEGLLAALQNKFKTFSESEEFSVYNSYRLIKNIKNKFLMRRGNPVSTSLFSRNELDWAENSGLFKQADDKLVFVEGKDQRELNEIMNEYFLRSEKIINKWKSSRLF